jgi:hypothetical protein
MQHFIPQWAGMESGAAFRPLGQKPPESVAWVRAAEAARFHGRSKLVCHVAMRLNGRSKLVCHVDAAEAARFHDGCRVLRKGGKLAAIEM